ncbi:MAG: GDSL-type esterase/lipase family protein [Candidatus Moraniibacteriota bacterium]
MKKIIWTSGGLILLGGITLLWFFWKSDGPVKNYPSSAAGPVLFLGDSLVEGVGATRGNDLSSLLQKGLEEPVLNYGVAGDTTASALERLEPALAEKPRLALILLGGNDFLRKIPRADTFVNLEKIITAFQRDGAMVILIGVRSGVIGGGADAEYEALAEKTQARSVPDVLSGVFGDASLMSDAIHPNDKGYAKIAERLLPVTKMLLGK